MTEHVMYLQRLTKDDQPTLGVFVAHGRFLCFSLEDRYREVKVAGDTCIPESETGYPLGWWPAGRWGDRFMKLGYPGVLKVHNVPGFTDILLHWGNTHLDTAGCPLTGQVSDMTARTVGRSKAACLGLYRLVARHPEPWTLRVLDPHLS